jgi:hypothetical protein
MVPLNGKLIIKNLGMMEEYIKEAGKMESSMVMENFSIQKRVVGKKEFGVTVEELNGIIAWHPLLKKRQTTFKRIL